MAVSRKFTMVLRKLIIVARPLMPMLIGLCLGIALSLLFAPLIEESCFGSSDVVSWIFCFLSIVFDSGVFWCWSQCGLPSQNYPCGLHDQNICLVVELWCVDEMISHRWHATLPHWWRPVLHCNESQQHQSRYSNVKFLHCSPPPDWHQPLPPSAMLFDGHTTVRSEWLDLCGKSGLRLVWLQSSKVACVKIVYVAFRVAGQWKIWQIESENQISE